jgi:hypothetical protein
MCPVQNVNDVPVPSSLRGLVFLARRISAMTYCTCFGVGVAGRKGPLRRVMEDGSPIAGWNQGGHSSLNSLWKSSPYLRL